MLTYGCHRIIHIIFYRTFDCQIALKCQNNCLVNRADECYVLELIQTIHKKSLEIREKKTNPTCLLYTGHFSYTSLTQCLNFLAVLSGQLYKIRTFFEGLRSSWGPQKQERKKNHNSTIFWAKSKIRMNCFEINY